MDWRGHEEVHDDMQQQQQQQQEEDLEQCSSLHVSELHA
jgi:hypothetical protein